jgi:hypothetical protein
MASHEELAFPNATIWDGFCEEERSLILNIQRLELGESGSSTWFTLAEKTAIIKLVATVGWLGDDHGCS